jgi:reverse gyrase
MTNNAPFEFSQILNTAFQKENYNAEVAEKNTLTNIQYSVNQLKDSINRLEVVVNSIKLLVDSNLPTSRIIEILKDHENRITTLEP